MNDKAAIEQLKRDLRTYGYYKGRIKEIESDLYNVEQQLKDCYKASGISYGAPMGSNDPKHTRVTILCNEEADLLLRRDEFIEEVERLGIDEKLKVLNDIQLSVIKSIYFDGLSYEFVANQMSYSPSGVKHHNNMALSKMLKHRPQTVE